MRNFTVNALVHLTCGNCQIDQMFPKHICYMHFYADLLLSQAH